MCLFRVASNSVDLFSNYSMQVSLNQAHHETLNCAAVALSTAMKEQSSLREEVCRWCWSHKKSEFFFLTKQALELTQFNFFFFTQLCTARRCLQKTAPLLSQLNKKAAAALKERDEQTCARDQAVKEREQVRCSLLYLKGHYVSSLLENDKVSSSFLTCIYSPETPIQNNSVIVFLKYI